jgi:cell fate regulator YaaT (PSP1 superfamily)
MAKEQSLSLSPTKISGLCGRLMCCLNYENEHYRETRCRMPRIGASVKTPDGAAEVTETNCLTERVKAKIELPDGTFEVRTYDMSDVKVKSKKSPPPKAKGEEAADREEKRAAED